MISGRELISGMAAQSGGDNSGDNNGDNSGDNNNDGTTNPGSGDGGCNTGFTFPVILAGIYFALRRKH